MDENFKCQRCGTCCQHYNPYTEKDERCPHLKYEENGIATCEIYDNRPWEICHAFPDPKKGEKCQNPNN